MTRYKNTFSLCQHHLLLCAIPLTWLSTPTASPALREADLGGAYQWAPDPPISKTGSGHEANPAEEEAGSAVRVLTPTPTFLSTHCGLAIPPTKASAPPQLVFPLNALLQFKHWAFPLQLQPESGNNYCLWSQATIPGTILQFIPSLTPLKLIWVSHLFPLWPWYTCFISHLDLLNQLSRDMTLNN